MYRFLHNCVNHHTRELQVDQLISVVYTAHITAHLSPSSSSGSLTLLRCCHQIDLLDSGSHCNVFTAALTTKNQRQDTHATIRHKAEDTTCLQEQRNVVSDTADCVFKGRIVIDVRTPGRTLPRFVLDLVWFSFVGE